RLLSRNNRDVTATYPEIQSLAEVVDEIVLDGEVVALDSKGRPSFGRLQQRMGLTRPAQVEAIRRGVPVAYLIFDILHSRGRSTVSQPYAERRSLLERLDLASKAWAVPPTAYEGGAEMLA